MLRAMARLNGDDQKSRAIGNRFSTTNRAKQAQRAKEAAAMGMVPMDPLEQHELQRKLDAEAKDKMQADIRIMQVMLVQVGRGACTCMRG